MSTIKKSAPKLNLTPEERKNLRKAKIKISELLDYAPDELELILEASSDRVKTIFALAEFQTVPSIGIKFAEDLIFMGYYSLAELKEKDGAKLLEEYERKKGHWTDPCVEDQFRLIVDFARNHSTTKNWWDYTEERKKYRAENGYPPDRPKTAWHEIIPIKWKPKK
ncbi:helix-hairpin-helix domain-containing protein [Algoriphagus marinus]|uniref:helix-hairpin-helix domain-containing protein n=1 Tax=Algoriphagus marinus TaxID=1925762 RepID=UPI00094B7C63|nr:helix-hairpin-helix domain-containing protein [Algoriphagus marinus]